MSDQGNEQEQDRAQGYVVPEDALERLDGLVSVLSEPLVAFTALLAGERDEARERARKAEALNNRLLKAVQLLVKEWPATSWVTSEDARDSAVALLAEVEQGTTMGSAEQPTDQETPPHGTSHDDPDPGR